VIYGDAEGGDVRDDVLDAANAVQADAPDRPSGRIAPVEAPPTRVQRDVLRLQREGYIPGAAAAQVRALQ